MTASTEAREAAWLEQTQSRRPLPATTDSRKAWESQMGDLDEKVTAARRAVLIRGFGEAS